MGSTPNEADKGDGGARGHAYGPGIIENNFKVAANYAKMDFIPIIVRDRRRRIFCNLCCILYKRL